MKTQRAVAVDFVTYDPILDYVISSRQDLDNKLVQTTEQE